MILKEYGSVFFENQELPKNTEVTSQPLDGFEGGANGGLLVNAQVKDLKLASEKKITFIYETSSDKKTWVELATVVADPKAEFIAQFVAPPSTKDWFRVKVKTDDANAAGTLFLWPSYLPR